jgi:hypothetical protein
MDGRLGSRAIRGQEAANSRTLVFSCCRRLNRRASADVRLPPPFWQALRKKASIVFGTLDPPKPLLCGESGTLLALTIDGEFGSFPGHSEFFKAPDGHSPGYSVHRYGFLCPGGEGIHPTWTRLDC